MDPQPERRIAMKRLIWLAALASAAPGLASAFSDNELRGIYGQMQTAGAIKCGMTADYLIDQAHKCKGAMDCQVPLITGRCRDILVIKEVGGSDPVITLNGKEFPQMVPTAPTKKKPMDTHS